MSIESRLKRIESLLEVNDLINEEEAAAFLGISKRYLQNITKSGRIPAKCYTLSVTGKRLYFKSKLKVN